MQTYDVVVECEPSTSIRARQVCGMFDVSPNEKCRLQWSVDLPTDETDWNVGLIVGPSGSGKSTIARRAFGESRTFDWKARSVIDDFEGSSVVDIAAVCQAVGFNTIPAWLRPFSVLSNGEKFRVELARHLLSETQTIVIDEFTSVVDRQIAKIGAHAVQKHIRANARRFVAVTCHYDVIDWLQPDWVLDMATNSFQRRRLQRRPPLDCVVGTIPRAAWRLFSPFHYLSATLNPSARTYGLWCEGQIAAFAAVLPRPSGKSVFGVSRLVTLPDWQGLGLAFVLADALGADYAAAARRLMTNPAHPALIRAFDRSPKWAMKVKPGFRNRSVTGIKLGDGRPCASFEYCGEAAERSILARAPIPSDD